MLYIYKITKHLYKAVITYISFGQAIYNDFYSFAAKMNNF